MAAFPLSPIVYVLGLWGDSLVANGNWPLTAATQLENLDVRVTVDNKAVAGQSNGGSFAAATTDIPIQGAITTPNTLRQKFCFWKYFSINGSSDPVLATDLQDDYDSYVQQFVDLCRANGMVTILMTHTPTSRITTGVVDDVRLFYNNEVRAKAASDVLIFDADSFMSNGASPARLIPAYSLDGTHYSAAGQAEMAKQLSLMLRAYYLSH